MVASDPFGIESCDRSGVRVLVERRLMSSTVPTRSPNLQASPSRMTSSASTETPPKPVLDVEGIQKLLPHRPPFLLVDRVVEFEANRRLVALKGVTMNEPFFQGHFPGAPVMPGVLILEALAQAAALLAVLSLTPGEADGKLTYLMGIDAARFRRPVVPGDRLEPGRGPGQDGPGRAVLPLEQLLRAVHAVGPDEDREVEAPGDRADDGDLEDAGFLVQRPLRAPAFPRAANERSQPSRASSDWRSAACCASAAGATSCRNAATASPHSRSKASVGRTRYTLIRAPRLTSPKTFRTTTSPESAPEREQPERTNRVARTSPPAVTHALPSLLVITRHPMLDRSSPSPDTTNSVESAPVPGRAGHRGVQVAPLLSDWMFGTLPNRSVNVKEKGGARTPHYDGPAWPRRFSV